MGAFGEQELAGELGEVAAEVLNELRHEEAKAKAERVRQELIKDQCWPI